MSTTLLGELERTAKDYDLWAEASVREQIPYLVAYYRARAAGTRARIVRIREEEARLRTTVHGFRDTFARLTGPLDPREEPSR